MSSSSATPATNPSTRLTVVAEITAKPGAEERIQQALTDLLDPTRGEDGCVLYDLHRSNENPAFFLFYEIWESRALWERHMAGAPIAAYQQKTEGLVAQWTLHTLERIG